MQSEVNNWTEVQLFTTGIVAFQNILLPYLRVLP
jgi:hypothetical protein